MGSKIEHEGVISRIDEKTIYVRIIQTSACSGCHAKAMCNASDMKEKIIEIPKGNTLFQEGEKVSISGKTTMGLIAVFYAFILPLLILLLALGISTSLKLTDKVLALVALLVLVLYYIILFLFRNQFKKMLVFDLNKN